MWGRGYQRGFSLLELLVAISILGLTLGLIYQAVGGATRAVGVAEKYAYGVSLAQSLLAENSVVPQEGVDAQGDAGNGYEWQVVSRPIVGPEEAPTGIQSIQVIVRWGGRQIALDSIVEEGVDNVDQ